MIDLYAKPIAITGASSGIGRATASACARAGMFVAVMARRGEMLDEIVAEIHEAGGRATAFKGDVTDPDSCAQFITHAEKQLGPLHAVFANAGYGQEQPTWSTPEQDLRDIFETNFWGSINTVRPALPGMIERGRGHVIFCSSCLSKIGLPLFGAYSATKACQDHFGRAMRHELRSAGVHVSTVHPIQTSTEFSDALLERSGQKARGKNRAGRGFIQPPETIANAVVKCLKKPKGEVWTSTTARLAMAVATAVPGLADLAISKMRIDHNNS